MLKRAAQISDDAIKSAALIEEAKNRFLENDQISEKHGNVTGLLLNPISICECFKMLKNFVEMLEMGKLLQKRAKKFKDSEKQIRAVGFQIEASRELKLDVQTLEAELERLKQMQK